MPATGKELVKRDAKDDDHYETASDSDAEHFHNQDQMIRQAPYLPKIQVWARKDGPYTLKVGHQWFHCDNLVINNVEYREGTKASDRYQPQQVVTKTQPPASPNKHRRPQAVRTASQQMMQNAQAAKEAEETRRRKAESDRLLAQRQEYDRQQEEAAAKRKAERTREKEIQAQRQAHTDRDRRDSYASSQVQWPEPRQSQGILVPPKQPRQHRPRMLSRRSTQDGGIVMPVRSKPKRVRFAKNA
ncbi:hypothetical protein H2198_007047 [Neophaeococcomyces mojaviensis]|uniref:Uncharacterized protein n=1 Tax=Neophaeococcomyces mojaviensis TaxID=3383035 RepID=A0ACC3A145_9EURO|nr:hypothetical protein H2198_007047 [Knufia sp. JES_112]